MKLLLEVLRTAYQWYMIHKTPFELTGLLLAVAGTAFAVLSIKDDRRLTKDLRAIFDHLTTKGIGAYPTYMPEVERLISEARDSTWARENAAPPCLTQPSLAHWRSDLTVSVLDSGFGADSHRRTAILC